MVNNILTIFQSFRTILCVCPKCNNIQRLSDLTLKFKGKVKKTWLDTYDSKIRFLEKKEDIFEEKEDELRKKSIERGRRKVEKIVFNSLQDGFMKTNYNPYDVKAILHPVDFVVFNGMTNGNIEDISFLSKQTNNRELTLLRDSVQDTIKNKRYDWEVARVSAEGKLKIEK